MPGMGVVNPARSCRGGVEHGEHAQAPDCQSDSKLLIALGITHFSPVTSLTASGCFLVTDMARALPELNGKGIFRELAEILHGVRTGFDKFSPKESYLSMWFFGMHE